MLKNKLKKIFSRTNNKTIPQMADIYNVIKDQWDPIENSQPFPEDPAKNKDIVGKWKCEKGRFWYETLEMRAHYQKCHMCYSLRCATEIYNLFNLRPDIAKEWHSTRNKGLTPDEVTPRSNKKVWWRCEKNHQWQTTIYNRSKLNGTNCPECSNKKVGKDNNLAVLRPDLVKEWHPIRNKGLIPNKVTPGSCKKIWWICKKNHEWQATILMRNKRTGCPECANKRVGRANNLAVLKPDLAAEWDQEVNGNLTAYDVTPGSSKKVGWKCKAEGHKWKAIIATRSRGGKCPFCYLKNLRY